VFTSIRITIPEVVILVLVLSARLKGTILMRSILLIVLLLIASLVFAETEPASMDDYTTCAVYHRMMAGSFRLKGDLQIMADLESEKMDGFIKMSKLAAAEEYGEASAEEYFLEEWRDVLAYMTDQINRNYENVSVLKARYKKRCDRLGASLVSGATKKQL
jgi:hypothetical protein